VVGREEVQRIAGGGDRMEVSIGFVREDLCAGEE
jgi:hypothetical protein